MSGCASSFECASVRVHVLYVSEWVCVCVGWHAHAWACVRACVCVCACACACPSTEHVQHCCAADIRYCALSAEPWSLALREERHRKKKNCQQVELDVPVAMETETIKTGQKRS